MSDDWLDEQLLADDVSKPGWRRRALGGMSKADALMGIPTKGQIQIQVPMPELRAAREHAQAMNLTMGTYARQAVGMRLSQEGFPPELLEAFLK